MQTTQQAADLKSAIKKTLNSSAFSKFMEQAVHAALADCPPQGIILRPRAGAVTSRFICGGSVLESSDESGWKIWLQKDVAGSHAPGQWFGSQSRLDQDGNRWICPELNYVIDDFGTLVPVSQ